MGEVGRFQTTIDNATVPVTVFVSGDVDAACAAAFATTLAQAGTTGDSIRVDLRAVSHLDSSAVRALFGLVDLIPVTLVVPRGGVVARVLTISGMDQVATVEFAEAQGQ